MAYDNDPIQFQIDHGRAVGNGYYIALDDQTLGANGQPSNANPTNPFYGALSGYAYANGNGFLDLPSTPLQAGIDTEFQVFAATANLAAKPITIYDGVWWGYRVASVPEPSTWILLASGCGIVALVRRRGLRAGRDAPLATAVSDPPSAPHGRTKTSAGRSGIPSLAFHAVAFPGWFHASYRGTTRSAASRSRDRAGTVIRDSRAFIPS